MRRVYAVLLLFLVAAAHGRSRRHHNVIHVAFPPTHQSLIDQNAEVDRLGLPRIKNDRQLRALVQAGELVPISTKYVNICPLLPRNRRYVKPWVNAFLDDLGAAYYDEFKGLLQVDSAVRPVYVQNRLRRSRHAAPSSGPTASSHLAGLTIDINRRGLTRAQLAFVEAYLIVLGDSVIVEEEVNNNCFHICVRGSYAKESDELD